MSLSSFKWWLPWSWVLWNFKRLWWPRDQGSGASSDCWVTLSDLGVLSESLTWNNPAIWSQATFFCLLYVIKNSENHALSTLKRYYCQMQLALPNKYEQKTRGITSCPMLKAVSHETELLCIWSFSNWCGWKFSARQPLQKFLLQWQRLRHIAKDMIKIEEDLVILATNRDPWETRLEPK